jgi:hypothetical protein
MNATTSHGTCRLAPFEIGKCNGGAQECNNTGCTVVYIQISEMRDAHVLPVLRRLVNVLYWPSEVLLRS